MNHMGPISKTQKAFYSEITIRTVNYLNPADRKPSFKSLN